MKGNVEMFKEVREGPRIKGDKRWRSRKKIEKEKHTKRKDITCHGTYVSLWEIPRRVLKVLVTWEKSSRNEKS